MEKYNIVYSCSCVHELQENDTSKHEAFHKPTGNNQDCKEHRR